MFKEKMHERLNSAKYTREEYGRITWRRSSMKKMILRSFDGRRNEVEGPIEKITWGEMKAARWNQQRRLPGGGWRLQDETNKDDYLGGRWRLQDETNKDDYLGGRWRLQDETNKDDYLGGMKAARWNQQRRLPGRRWRLQDETNKDDYLGGDGGCKMKPTKMGRTLLWRQLTLSECVGWEWMAEQWKTSMKIPIVNENEMRWALEYTQKLIYWNILRSWRVLERSWKKPIWWWLGSDEWNHGGTKTFHKWKEGYWSTRIKVNIWKPKW